MATIKMTPDKAKELTRKAMGTSIAKNRDKVIALLKKYGIAIDKSYSDDELIVGVLQAVRSDKKGRFKNDLANLLTETVKMNFTGEEGQGFFNADSGTDPWATMQSAYSPTNPGSPVNAVTSGNVANTSSTVKPKSALGTALSQNLGNIFTSGLSVLSTTLTNKSNQKLADTALSIEAEKTKQAALQAGGGGGGSASTGLSTGAKIGIAIGALTVIGLIVYVVVKK